MNPSPSLSLAAVAALQQGNKIEAIKIVRAERNLGLKEAKDAVEQYVRGQPALQAALAASQADSRRRMLPWLIAAIAIAFAASYFLLGR